MFQELNYNYEVDATGEKFIFVALLIILLIFIVSIWKLEKKIRNKGWIALIPFYNIGCLTKDILGSYWYALLLVIPIGNVAFLYLLYYYMGQAFKKSDTYCMLLMFFPHIVCPLLAFDNSIYSKPETKLITRNLKKNIKKNKMVETKIKEKSTRWNLIYITIKWILTAFLLFLSSIILLTFFFENLIGYLILSIIFLIYGLLACPMITSSTKKYVKYTKFKLLIVIVLIIINVILLGILPF